MSTLKMPPVRARNLAAAGSAALGSVFTWITFAPGYLPPESLRQLEQARSGAINDFQQPLATWLMGEISAMAGHPGGIFFLQVTAFWAGLAFLARMTLRSPLAIAATVLGVGLLPPFQSQISTIWGVVTAGSFFLLALGLLVLAWQRKSRYGFIPGLAALAFACAMHSDAPYFVAPVLVWAGWISSQLFPIRRRGAWSHPWVHAAVFATAFGVMVFGGIHLLNRAIAADRNFYPEQVVTEAESNRELKRQWWRGVREAPGAYLAHRNRVFARAMGGGGAACYPFHDGIGPNSLGLTFEPGMWNRAVMSVFDAFKGSVVFRGWFYFLGAVIAALSALRLGRVEVGSNLLAVGTLLGGMSVHAVSRYFSATACDFRLGWWYVLGALGVVMIGYSTRWRRDWEPPRPAWMGASVKGTPRGGPLRDSRGSKPAGRREGGPI